MKNIGRRVLNSRLLFVIFIHNSIMVELKFVIISILFPVVIEDFLQKVGTSKISPPPPGFFLSIDLLHCIFHSILLLF